MADHLEPAGHILQNLAHVGADLAQGAAAPGAGAFGGAMLHLAAWQMLGQRLAAAAARHASVLALIRSAGFDSLGRGGLRLQLLQRQFKLRDLVP